MEQGNSYQVHQPYPPVQVEGVNREYGKLILSNLGGRDSEMSAVSLYFYNHLVTQRYREVALAFHKISIVEMHHLEIFGELALRLGEDPRLWQEEQGEKKYWTPAYNEYSFDLQKLLRRAIQSEKGAVRKYKSQMQVIRDPYILANLERIILDEDRHAEIFTQLYETYFQ